MLLLLLLLCTPASHADWEKISSADLPALTPDGSLKDFRLALTRQKENCRESRAGHFHNCGNEGKGPPIECDEPALEKLAEISAAAHTWKQFYEKAKPAFDWYREKDPVLFTAYNSPVFPASLKRTKKFPYPLYSPPPGLVPKQYDRKAIEVDHALQGKGLEIAWLSSPANILRLQIEGSGVLQIGKKQIGVNYAAKNGFPYVSIFKILPEVKSFPALDVFAREHKEEFQAALAKSPSYVFFTLATEPPCGSARVHVTGGHSLAIDPTFMPFGTAAFLSAERPRESGKGMKPFTRFAFAQDTGGAIKGKHVDVYFGTGDYANLASNGMKASGQIFLLRSKGSRAK
jgi:membrane-bound lytic murein transglycosylase A